jgi:hypothetical protein
MNRGVLSHFGTQPQEIPNILKTPAFSHLMPPSHLNPSIETVYRLPLHPPRTYLIENVSNRNRDEKQKGPTLAQLGAFSFPLELPLSPI